MIEIDVLAIQIPCHRFFSFLVLIILLNASSIMINRKGERGSPCQSPCEEPKNIAGEPLMIVEKEALEMHALIHLHHLREKLNLCSTLKRKSLFNFSYAFVMSSLIIVAGILCTFMEWRVS